MSIYKDRFIYCEFDKNPMSSKGSKMEFSTIPEMYHATIARVPDCFAFFEKKEGSWVGLRYRDVEKRVEDFASGLSAMGVGKGDKIAILSGNNSKWAITDYAVACLGGITVTVFPSLIPSQIHYILDHSDTKYIVCEDEQQIEKVVPFLDSSKSLRGIISMKGGCGGKDHIIDYEKVIKKGRVNRKKTSFPLKGIAKNVRSDDLLTLVYTSGTTGDPKGVMLTHGNLVSNVIAGRKAIRVTREDRFLSFLPLSHAFERMVGHYTAFSAGSAVYYAEGIEQLAANMEEVRPTVMASVPRLFEKMHAKVVDRVNAGPGLKRKMFWWAIGVGQRSIAYLQRDRKPKGLLGFKFGLANRLVFSKLKERVGGNLRFFVSGGAPLSKEVGEFFASANIPILEGYGLTETSPVITVNRRDFYKFGTVGAPVKGVEVRIADDGEVHCRGKNVMRGYYKNDEATKEVIDEKGWFRTGDIGMLDEDGYLRITDRKKNLIVTSCGKNVAPVPLEKALSTSRYVEQCMVIGDNLKFISALIVPCYGALEDWARSRGIEIKERKDLLGKTEVQKLFDGVLRETMEAFASYERVKKYSLLPEEWTVENDMLTPTLKTKRREILKRYAPLVEKMYRC